MHVVVEVEICDLRLDHPEFREMAPGLRFFGAKRRPEAIDLAKGERPRLGIELSALGQICLALAEVVELEQVAGAFARGRGQDRSIEDHEAALVKEVAAGLN